MDEDEQYDLRFNEVSDAAEPRGTRVYTGHYLDTLARCWE